MAQGSPSQGMDPQARAVTTPHGQIIVRRWRPTNASPDACAHDWRPSPSGSGEYCGRCGAIRSRPPARANSKPAPRLPLDGTLAAVSVAVPQPSLAQRSSAPILRPMRLTIEPTARVSDRGSRARTALIVTCLFALGAAIGYGAANMTRAVRPGLFPAAAPAPPTGDAALIGPPAQASGTTSGVTQATSAVAEAAITPGSNARPTASAISASDVVPIVTPPEAKLGSRLTWTGIELELSWPAATGGATVPEYELDASRDGGTYRSVDLPQATALGATVSAIANHRYDFRLRARSPDGQPGPYATSAVRLSRIEERGASVEASGGWNSTEHVDYSGSSARSATAPGAELTLSFTGTGVAVVGPRGPGNGRAEVLVDARRVGEFDAASDDKRAVDLLFAVDSLPNKRHTLTVRVADSPGRPVVTVDRFLVLSVP